MPQKFWTTVPRYVDGKYVVASPDHPALVEFPDHLKVKADMTLVPVETEDNAPKELPKPKLIAPFADVRRGPPGKLAANAGKRPSDMDPA